MNRLIHSFDAHRRAMQLSRTPIFVFVEGDNDVPVYAKISKIACLGKPIFCEVVKAKQLNSQGGGKEILLKYHEYLKTCNSLIDNFHGKKTLSFIYLDKDIDDLMKIMERSGHIAYTQMYNIENYLFLYGNLSKSISQLSQYLKQDSFSNAAAWSKRYSTQWIDWVKICVFSELNCTANLRNYACNTSCINKNICGPIDTVKYKNIMKKMQKDSKLKKRFSLVYDRVSKMIDNIYKNNQQNKVFKGNWYYHFVLTEISACAKNRKYLNVLSYERLIEKLIDNLDYSQAWTNDLVLPLTGLVSKYFN